MFLRLKCSNQWNYQYSYDILLLSNLILMKLWETRFSCYLKAHVCVKCCLTHLSLEKMTTISQTIFSYAFSLMKSFILWFEFPWSLLKFSIGLDNGLALNRQQAIIWTNADQIHRHICVTWGRWVKSINHHIKCCQSCNSNFPWPNWKCFSLNH